MSNQIRFGNEISCSFLRIFPFTAFSGGTYFNNSLVNTVLFSFSAFLLFLSMKQKL